MITIVVLYVTGAILVIFKSFEKGKSTQIFVTIIIAVVIIILLC